MRLIGRWQAWTIAGVLLCCAGVGAEPPSDDPPAGVPPVAPGELLPVQQPDVDDAAGNDAAGKDAAAAAAEESVLGGLEQVGNILRLTLDGAMHMALEANLNLKEGAYAAPLAYQGWLQQDASFDALLTAGFEVARRERPTGSALFGKQVREDTASAYVQVSRQLREGSQVSLLYQADRLDTSQLIIDINPSWTNTVLAEVRHPLLRGSGSVVQTDVRKAANDIAAAQAGFDQAVQQVLITVAEAYWELAFAQNSVETRRKSESVAQKLLEDQQSREQAGVATPLDVAQARSGLQRRRSDRIATEGARRDISDQLLALIRPFSVTEISDIEILAIDDMMQVDERASAATEKNFVQMALRGRPELRVAQADISNRGLDQVAAHNSIRPQLDLVGRVGSTDLQNNLGDSLGGMFEGENITAVLGVEFSVFLGQRAAKARWRAAGWARRQAVLRMRELENQIVLDVRRALRALRVAEAVLMASEAEVRAAQESLDGEILRLNEGKSTPFRVLQLEDDRTLARNRVARAASDGRRAEALLWRAVGTLAQRHGGRAPRFPACRTGCR